MHLLKLLSIARISQFCRETRALVLTYDDGPGLALTPRLIDLLAAYRQRATFFLLGGRVIGNEAIAERVVGEGHEIGCHAHDHLHAWKVWPWRAVADINRGYQTLAPWLAQDALFRPPYGKLTLPTWLAIRRRGARIGWWTIDSGDTRRELPEPHSVADRVTRAGGGVVLMHDFDRGAERERFVLRTTELLLQTAKREGLDVCRYSDLFCQEVRPECVQALRTGAATASDECR